MFPLKFFFGFFLSFCLVVIFKFCFIVFLYFIFSVVAGGPQGASLVALSSALHTGTWLSFLKALKSSNKKKMRFLFKPIKQLHPTRTSKYIQVTRPGDKRKVPVCTIQTTKTKYYLIDIKNIFLLGQFTMTPYYQSTSTCIYNELTLSKAFYRYNKTKCHEFKNVVSKETVIFSAF